mmetsp:Transcript_89583/g.237926  ORF Transcript_89583/g.237926 Transcript_89583/m.237926 type:complete len:240 (+) Transcript_89583:653-1372(+)
MATASFTVFMPSSSLMETMCTWARMYMESITRVLSPIFLDTAMASLAASSARSLSFVVFLPALVSSAFSTNSTSEERIKICTMPYLSPMSCMRFLAMRAASKAACQSLLSARTLASMCRDLASPLTEAPSLKMERASPADSSASAICPQRLWMLAAANRAIASSFLSPSFTANSRALLAANSASVVSPSAMCTSIRISCAFACSCPQLSSWSKTRQACNAACSSFSGCCLRMYSSMAAR